MTCYEHAVTRWGMGKPTEVLSVKIDKESDTAIERARVINGVPVYDRSTVVRRVLLLARRAGLFERLEEAADVDAGEEAAS